ncbi:hypothetical protein [Variovorax sp. GB1P17]|uniref:hypothetical protein n=1 Tax=Variovorax sp. GB1P17 TaxID=3443740 RepID=UPI003F47118C
MPLNAQELKQLAEAGEQSTVPACGCWLHRANSWESITEERWPADLLLRVDTLRADGVDEPTFEEFHPHGTRYDSADAPISVAHFPFNRCDVFRCVACARLVLRYTEFGGYYVDHRARRVDAALVTV